MRNRVIQVGGVVDDSNIGFKNPQRGRVYDARGIAPCIYTFGGGNLEPKIVRVYEDRIYNLVGDRDRPRISIKDIAFTIATNPMSDRDQRVIEIDEED